MNAPPTVREKSHAVLLAICFYVFGGYRWLYADTTYLHGNKQQDAIFQRLLVLATANSNESRKISTVKAIAALRKEG
ncbi:hypothetical protein [Chroococcidiopsis sp. TS-821]|uniref:hypothetical protein n=1 Tax=Chroococcidiopsis sp. TS-821 TaxID=1378066 RepID=UPI000CEEE3DF|nr:hypothetical protein [Chroococcidiopsis sp. TS-821]PPS43195.1 hypothetical protein B1A85_10840 [Chroococcidiopsis sp. TS-821]